MPGLIICSLRSILFRSWYRRIGRAFVWVILVILGWHIADAREYFPNIGFSHSYTTILGKFTRLFESTLVTMYILRICTLIYIYPPMVCTCIFWDDPLIKPKYLHSLEYTVFPKELLPGVKYQHFTKIYRIVYASFRSKPFLNFDCIVF